MESVYLKSDDLSDSQEQARHEGLHISDIMFDRVNLRPSATMVGLVLYRLQKMGIVKQKTYLSWAREVNSCTRGKPW